MFCGTDNSMLHVLHIPSECKNVLILMLVSHNIVTDLNNITFVFRDFQSSPNSDAKLFHNTDAKKQRAKEQRVG